MRRSAAWTWAWHQTDCSSATRSALNEAQQTQQLAVHRVSTANLCKNHQLTCCMKYLPRAQCRVWHLQAPSGRQREDSGHQQHNQEGADGTGTQLPAFWGVASRVVMVFVGQRPADLAGRLAAPGGEWSIRQPREGQHQHRRWWHCLCRCLSCVRARRGGLGENAPKF